MKLLELTRDAVAENLALDEALIEEAEAGRLDSEVLRLWEMPAVAVVVGRSSRVVQEVDQRYCGEQDIPVLRRCSGGAAVVIGPGCLMYSVLLSCRKRPELRMIDATHQFVLGQVARAVNQLGFGAALQGISDLALDGRKFSGNSLRCKREHVLYHGTLLCQFPLELISRCLLHPPRQPAYRASRSHAEFVTNLDVPASELAAALIRQWNAQERLDAWPESAMHRLRAERYDAERWNLRY